ncbi:MAG: hypothetical protein KC777_14445 [Cyanobacteria bacterium HKST-UBA02]|nr:hypothetical protein [Cyanobacteria bacterium HKST-UBA02]
MIRLGKPVQLLEWGEGSNTTNQCWTELGVGRIVNRPKPERGITTLVIELEGKATKQNSRDDAIKVAQKGQGMTPGADKWGEVAFGRLKSLADQGGKTVVEIELKFATKLDSRVR